MSDIMREGRDEHLSENPFIALIQAITIIGGPLLLAYFLS
tara:strand:- start:4589 stop:4708 length:120 start_codon:yes stop_codon:yes gene_type:complete